MTRTAAPAATTPASAGQPATSQRDRPHSDRLLTDYGDNRTLELALIVRSWHGIGRLTASGPTCKHCLPTSVWPCPAFDLAQQTIVSLTRDEPYGPPETNEYLRQVLAAEAELATREMHGQQAPVDQLGAPGVASEAASWG